LARAGERAVQNRGRSEVERPAVVAQAPGDLTFVEEAGERTIGGGGPTWMGVSRSVIAVASAFRCQRRSALARREGRHGLFDQ
jgi:hypothetical protein